jgi:hypothetical protein
MSFWKRDLTAECVVASFAIVANIASNVESEK